MHCSVCYSDLQSIGSVILPCSCSSCSDCLIQWIAVQADELYFQTNGKVMCMNENCRQLFEPEFILLQLTSDQQITVNNALFSVYLRKTSDIRHCPNGECNYAGMIDTSTPCKDNVECTVCGTQWREKAHYSTKDKIKEFFVNNSAKRSETLSDIWQEMFSRRCPKCNVSIEKSGGCDHMTCKKCGHEFCWVCSQRFHGHIMTFCAMASIIKIMIVAVAVVNIFWMVGVVQVILAILGWAFIFVIKCIILNMFAGGAYFLRSMIIKKRSKILQTLAVGYLVILWFVAHVNRLYVDLCLGALAEVGLLGAGMLYHKRMRRWVISTY